MLPLYFWLKQALKTTATGISLACLVLISHASTAAITIEPITWNVIGLDSNKPATAQPAPQVFPPDRYPVGVEVCNSDGSELTGHKAVFVWDESPSTNYIHLWDSTVNWNDTDSSGDPITGNDGEGIDELPVPDVADGTCEDVYFWVQIEQVSAAYDFTRDFHIELWDDSATPSDSALDGTKIAETANNGSTLGLDEERELYVEYLVSQNRNAVLGFSVDGTSVTPGGSIAVKPGDTIQVVFDAKTATQGYEQLEVFLALPPDLFTINSVATTYSANSGTDPNAVARLYADGCGWENDPNSADGNYHNNLSCAGTGKYGGVIQQVYSITISENFSSSVTGQALIYDFSGSSYHYNSDYESATLTFTVDSDPIVLVGDLSITKSTDTAAQDEFFLTITNEGTNTFSGGSTIGFEIVDELPVGYSTKQGAANQITIEEFTSAGISKASQSGSSVESQVVFYNLSAAQNGGTEDLGDPTYDAGERYIIWTPSPTTDFSPGDYITFGFQVAPLNNAVGENPYENCAVISTADDDASNNQSCVTLPPPEWDLGITKQVTGVSTNQATFQLSVTNYGPDSSVGVLVEDVLPAGYTSPTGYAYSGDVTMSGITASNPSAGILVWDLPALAANETATVSYSVTIELPTGNETDEQSLNDRYLNVARLVDSQSPPKDGFYKPEQRIELFDGVLANNIASASAAPTLLEINKTPDSGTIAGPTYDYKLEITKVGVFQAGDLITVVEAPPPGMRITAIAGDGWDCTTVPALPTTDDKVCTRTVAGGDPATYPVIDVAVELDPIPVGAKTYVNTSYVEATRGGNPLFNTFDSDSVIAATLEADLRLAKSTPSSTPDVGSTVIFTLTLTNDGPDTATNVEVTDSLPTGYQYVADSITDDGGKAVPNDSDATSLKWTVDSIAKDESVVLSYEAKILPSGIYTNTAQVTASDQPDPDSSPNNEDGDQSEDDEAAVTLSPRPVIDLALGKTASERVVFVGDTVTYSLAVTNEGPSDATGVSIEDVIPAELTYDEGSASDGGSFADGKLSWSNLSVSAGATKTLTYDVLVSSVGKAITNTAQVTAANQHDIDSTPNNGGGDQPEDDEASETIEASRITVAISGLVFSEITKTYDGLKSPAEQPTDGGGLYVCIDTTPARFAAVGTGSVGAFAFTELEPNTTYSLILTTESSGDTCPTSSTLNQNRFSTGESVDGVTPDSTVVPGESLSDGKLSVSVGTTDVTTITMGLVQADVFDPPFGLKTGEILEGRPVIRWTMVWINDSPIPVVGAQITDPPPPGTTYVDGSISCEPRGTTTVSVCDFDTDLNTVNVVADFGPETGSPMEELSAENELLIIFEVTYDEVNPEPEYANQGKLSWNPGNGPKTSFTDDPTEPGGSDPSIVVPRVAAPATPVPVNPWQILLAVTILIAWLGRIGLIRRRSW